MKLLIYGAQGYALGAYDAITSLYPKRKVFGFLVSEKGKNATELAGVPVQVLSEFAPSVTMGEKQNIEVGGENPHE